MAISSPVTPGQVSFLLGVVPIIAAWIYSEFLEYKKNCNCSKARHSDINLVEVGNDTIKEDDKAVLLEGGGLHAASPRARSSSTTSPLIRFLLMDESFLIENRLTLRAIAEFSVLLAYYYICDRTDVFNSSQKVKFFL
ncbi:protein REDUCED WALL ACETYLATION 2 isoform X1 [Carica papaya]|uniref:protein REDUCED WALL ACETYLATION 2 isoform X1 n=1 Tax=Carica papaya TaxID=3649 RepID=UPI000B8C8560|nr:protein REDUCED WALL ACETYLATION 2 isoform X1 [Carica papaya]